MTQCGRTLMDTIHALYLAEHLAGEEVQAGSAVIDNLGYAEGQVEDLALLHLYFQRSFGKSDSNRPSVTF